MPQLRHVEWFGFTVADLVYPFFLFLSGVSWGFSEHWAALHQRPIRGARAGGRADLIGDVADGYYDRILGVWTQRSIEIAARLVRGLFPDADSTDTVDAWLIANPDAPGALRRIVVEQRDHLARELRVRAGQPTD